MFIIVLSYKKPLAEVNRFVGEHREFLQSHYASGQFLLSGPRQPRTGGIIVAKADSREDVERIIQDDPFHREQIAEYEIIEFIPSMTAPLLSPLAESLTQPAIQNPRG